MNKKTKILTIDSRDRDPSKFVKIINGASSSDPGDYVVYLPRVYEKVSSLRLKSATIQGVSPSDMYVLLGIEGLNVIDETASGADRSGYVDSAFAKITNDVSYPITGVAIASAANSGSVNTYTTTAAHPFVVGQVVQIYGSASAGFNQTAVLITVVASPTTFGVVGTSITTGTGVANAVSTLQYNDKKCDEFVARFSPPLAKIDRLRITWRRHVAPSLLLPINTTSTMTAPITFGSAENTLSFEIETLENSFDDFSTFESRLNRH